jgi:hypothetical protein
MEIGYDQLDIGRKLTLGPGLPFKTGHSVAAVSQPGRHAPVPAADIKHRTADPMKRK